MCGFIERTFVATAAYAHVATELGYLFILQDQVKEASLWYSEAMKLDESSVAALTGLCGPGKGGGGGCGKAGRKVASMGPEERRWEASSLEGV